jgi:hypothetical protein
MLKPKSKAAVDVDFDFDFDFDFNILTAFIRLGRARPVGVGCPPYYYLTLLFDFII